MPIRNTLTALAVAVAVVWAAGATPAKAEHDVTDKNITRAIEDEYMFDHAVEFNEIDVTTLDGVVTLNGTVDTLLNKKRAANIARTVKGVRSVVNNLKVSYPKTRTNSQTQSDVETALLTDPATDSYEVSTSVSGTGRVTLTGTVDSWQERELTEKVVMGVRGVTGINNNITVEYPTERSDIEIKPEIKSALKWNQLVDHGLIDVKVNDGKVTLSGVVGSASEKREAEIDAWVYGVKSVNTDKLKVAEWARNDDLRKDKYVAKSADKIAEAIEDAFVYDPRVNSFDINVEMRGRVAVLRGEVDNVQAKRAAEQDAMNTVGVYSVDNRMKVRPSGSVTDEKLEERVEAALLRDPQVERYEIDVNVYNGVAYLYGNVDSYFEKGQADDVTSRVNGVRDVRNYLNVAIPEEPLVYDPYVYDWQIYDYDWYDYEPGRTMQEDAEILDEINDELFWSPFVDSDDITVSVKEGVATLNGTVDSWSEWRAATENAYEGGAIWVDNDLTVQAG